MKVERGDSARRAPVAGDGTRLLPKVMTQRESCIAVAPSPPPVASGGLTSPSSRSPRPVAGTPKAVPDW